MHLRNGLKMAAVILVSAMTFGPIAAQTLSRANPEDVGMSASRLQRVSAVLERYIESGDISGGVALVSLLGLIALK